LKKSVLAHKGYVISSYEEATVGKKSPATIVSLKPNGARVEFFNNVYAFLPKLEMSEAFVKDPKDIFRLGQSINVRVISSQPDEQRMLVSARGDSDSSAELQEQFDSLEAGRSIVSALAIEKTKDSVIFELEPNKVRGILHLGHISDNDKEDVKISLLKKLEVNKVIDELLVLQKDERKNTVFLTLKKSLIDAAKAEELPRSIDDIHPSQVLHGFVSNVTATGVFVTFANRVTGLAYKSELFKNTVVEDPTKFFKKFQSVTCVVTNVDADAERFTVSLKEFGNQQVNKKVLNPVDPSIKALSDFKVGRVIDGRIKKIADTYLNIDLADNQAGRLDISQIYDTLADIKDPKNPLKVFKTGQTIKVKIIGYYHSHHQKQIAENDGVSSVFELSAKPSDLKSKNTEQQTFENIVIGSKWVAFVRNISNDSIYLNVAADVAGRISLIELSEQLRTPHEHEELYPIGSAIQVTVVSKSTTNSGKLLDLTTRDDTTKVITNIEDLTEGQILTGQIGKKLPMGIAVRLGNNVSAVVYPTDIADEFTPFDEITSTFTEGTFTKIKIVTVDKHNERVFGSLRKSVVEGDVAEEDIVDKVVNEVSDVHSGDLIRGYVSNIANSGLFVSLGRNVSGRVMIKDITDGFVQDWKSLFKLHQLVKVRVLAVRGNRIELSLKKSAVGGKGVAGAGSFKDFNELEVGDIVTGHIKKIEEYGVFVTFDNTNNVDGLCHRSQISDTQIKDFSKLFSLGDRVKAKILAIDTEKRRISIGLKASYFDDEDEEMEDASEEEDEEMADASDSDSDNGFSRFNDSDDDEEENDGSDSSDEEPEPASFAGLASGTGLSAGFDWNTSILDNDAAAASDADSDEESSDSDSDADTRKKNKKNKRKAKKLIVEDKTAELGTKAPESVGDFERLLVGSPNSSVIWMSFMAFQLQLSEVDKAREIAERALKTISFREEDEKLNIWVAYLNLENSFGTEDSLEEVFKRATQYMDSRTVYEKMGKIYTMSGKIDKACNVYDAMCKKFNGETTSVWETYGQMLYEQASAATASGNKADADRYLNKARSVLDRALRLMKNSNLHSKKTEAELISKFARFEYAHGDQERGRTLFEGLVSSYPRRVDLWNVYIDQEIKHSSDRGLVEALFERVVGAGSAAGKGIGMKQAKFFFKKWLAYEDVHGDSKAVDYVKAKAAEYVSSRTASEA
jgi:rRNA biogenesis protein RRP5